MFATELTPLHAQTKQDSRGGVALRADRNVAAETMALALLLVRICASG